MLAGPVIIIMTMEKGLADPFYVSKPMARNGKQGYRVYADRVELDARVRLGTFVIPAEDIISVEVRPPPAVGDLFRGRGFFYSLPLKIDAVDFFEHVAIHRRSGLIRHIRFTPDDPEKFVSACKSIMK